MGAYITPSDIDSFHKPVPLQLQFNLKDCTFIRPSPELIARKSKDGLNAVKMSLMLEEAMIEH